MLKCSLSLFKMFPDIKNLWILFFFILFGFALFFPAKLKNILFHLDCRFNFDKKLNHERKYLFCIPRGSEGTNSYSNFSLTVVAFAVTSISYPTFSQQLKAFTKIIFIPIVEFYCVLEDAEEEKLLRAIFVRDVR